MDMETDGRRAVEILMDILAIGVPPLRKCVERDQPGREELRR